jgi:glucan biosynthesis protein C
MKLLSAGDSIKLKQERLYYLDWLRVLIVLGVFYAHTIYIFDLLYWHTRSGQQSSSLESLSVFTSEGGMSFLFLLSGASTWFALRSRTGRQFIIERFTRLGIPFIAGFILLAPLQAYFEALILSRYQGSFFQFYLHFFASIHVSWNVQWVAAYGYHLWFLAFLLLISALVLPVLVFLRRKQGQQFIAWLAALSVRRGGLFVFVLPIALLQIALQVPFPGYQGWADFFSWLVFFLYGYIILSDRRFERAIERQGKIALLSGMACYLVSMVWEFGGFLETWEASPGYSVGYMLYQFLRSAATWSLIVFILYLGVRFLNVSNSIIQYGNEAILPFYVLHYLVILITTFYVVQLSIGIVAQFLIISTGSLMATLALYELVIRRVNAMRWLFGMKPRKRVGQRDLRMKSNASLRSRT